jgi:hypothetical protein
MDKRPLPPLTCQIPELAVEVGSRFQPAIFLSDINARIISQTSQKNRGSNGIRRHCTETGFGLVPLGSA